MGRARYAALRGELGQAERFVRLAGTSDSGSPQRLLRDSLTLASADAWFRGAGARDVARIDGALALYPLRTMAMADRPYVEVWKNAGTDLQPVVADARRRLGRLMKGEKR